MNDFARLTKKTALMLIRRELGIVAQKTEDTKLEGVITSYTCYAGSLRLQVQNDWNRTDGCLQLHVNDSLGTGSMLMLFNAKTLERDYLAEDIERGHERENHRREWVQRIGLEAAKRAIARYDLDT